MKLAAAFGCLALAACSSAVAEPESARLARLDPVMTCVARGVAYFERIGSFPTLREPPNEGRPARIVAQERCEKAVTAF
jgi:hypothetical protein